MIKFFRKIRQRLLTENRVGKYVLYAFGEIILVVIGILIALGINNWNTRKNIEQKEQEALIEIYQDLRSDNQQLSDIIKRENEIVRSIDLILAEFKERNSFPNDSLQVYLGKSFVGDRSRFVTAAYDVLISSGIGLIQDKDIRYNIADYYGKDLPLIVRDGNDMYQEWYNDILPIIREESEHWAWGKILIPYSMDSFFENKEIFAIIKTNKQNHFDSITHAEDVMKRNQNLLSIIKQAIKT